MRRLIWCLPVFFIVAFSLPMSRALADDPCLEDSLACVADTAVSFSAAASSQHAGTLGAFNNPEFNYVSDPPPYYASSPSSSYLTAMIKYELPSSCALESYNLQFSPLGQIDNYVSMDVRSGGTWRTIIAPDYNYSPGIFTYSGSVGGDPVDEIQIEFNSNIGARLSLIRFSAAEGCAGGGGGPSGYSMPLKSDDMHPDWGMYDDIYIQSLDPEWPDNDEVEPVVAYSNKLSASVHAVAPGTVTAVDYDITSQCTPMDEVSPHIPLSPHACFVTVPSVISGKPLNQIFTVTMANTALVLVKSDDDPLTIFTYFVSNPTVSVGDHVEAGCIVGETIALNNSPLYTGDVEIGATLGSDGASGNVGVGSIGINNTIRTGESVTVVRMDTMTPEVVRLYPALTEEPDESACASNFSGCLNGGASSLLSLTDWITTSGVSLLSGGGVSLPGSTQIYQTNNMTLDDAATYTMTVQARSTTAGDGFTVVNRIRLFIGEDIQEYPITTQWEPFTIEFLGEDLSAGEAYGAVNRNAAGVGIEIRYICISGENATATPNSCYFNNHHFDNGPRDWTYDGGVTFQSGQAFTYNDSILEQSAQLWPLSEGDATYNLTIAGRLIATNAYTGQSGKYVDLSYRFPMSGDYALIGEIDSAKVGSEGKSIYSGDLDLEHTYVLTVPITVSSYTTGLFSIKTSVTDSDNYLKGFRIDYACLQSTTDDGSFPGQGGSGFNPPFYENCEVVAVPQDNNISSWTYYHWSNLNRFFSCTLMVTLNKMAATVDTAWKTTRLFMRWIVATGQMSGRWLSTQVFSWLGGNFNNLILGAGNVTRGVSETVTTSANIIDDAKNFVEQVGKVVKQLTQLIQTIINQFLNLYNFAVALISTIVGAFSESQAIAIPNLPQCTLGPDESFICTMIWILDNTVFAGTGQALIPVLLSFGSAHLLLWLVAEFKKNLLEQGQAL